VLSGYEILKALQKQGFNVVGRKGSHIRLKKKGPEGTWIVTVPVKKAIKPITLMSIIKQSGYTKQEFLGFFGKRRKSKKQEGGCAGHWRMKS